MADHGRIPTRKLKLNKKFEPLPVDEGDELFANGIFEFNVTALLAFIAGNPDRFPVTSVEVKALSSNSPDRLNEATIRSANVSVPVILAEISPGRFNVIDGNHRIERARRDGREAIMAHHVRAEQHLAFLTSVKAYEAYVRYWNEKIADARSGR